MANEPGPDETAPYYDQMRPVWEKIQTVLDGTTAMRAAGDRYLPPHEAETTVNYENRRKVSTLLNMSAITLNSWVGRPFSDPVQVSDNFSPIMVPWLNDIDLLGNNIDVYARNWFRDGVAKSLSHTYVEFPRLLERPDGQPRTLADDRRENLRPHWIHYRPESVFFADADIVDGREFFTELRIMEHMKRRNGFAVEFVEQIRRIFLDDTEQGIKGHVELYQKKEKKSATAKDEWIVVDRWLFDLDFIPFVPFYAEREGFMRGKPPLEDLVDLNIAHWQSSSDQRNILTVSRYPMLALSGGSDDQNELVAGPRTWLQSPQPGSRFYYVEPVGTSIEQGRKDLEDLRSQMSEYGAEFLKKRPNRETATARALDSAEATSPLQDITVRFIDALNLAADYTMRWMGAENAEGLLSLLTDFGPDEIRDEDLISLRETRKARDISREKLWEEYIRRGVLDSEFDMDLEKQRLEAEMSDPTQMPSAADLDDGDQRQTA